jgi:RraA family protein
MSNVGFRIYTKINRPDRQLIENFRGLPVAVIADEMNRLGCMAARIKPLNQVPLLGVAFTVKVRAGDNLMVHRALDMALAGDVIVVDGQGDLSNAIAGENMMMWAQRRQLAGVIIDGAVRDLDSLRNLEFAVFAAGIQPKGPYKNGPGEINVPVCCGGVVINPGDIIVGDEDGVVSIHPVDAPTVCKKAHARHQKEGVTRQAIVDGSYDRSAYTEDALRKMGCEVIDAAWSQQTAEEKV